MAPTPNAPKARSSPPGWGAVGSGGGQEGGAFRTRLLAILRLAVSAALVGWVLQRARLAEVAAALRGADLGLVLLALALSPLGYWSSVSRWRLLLRTQGVDVPFGFLVRSFAVGIFFNNLLPSTIGGDAVRAWDSSRAGAGASKAVAVVLVDRFLGLFTLMAIAAGGVLVSPRLTERVPALHFWVLAGTAAMGLAFWLLFAPSSRAERLLTALAGKLPERLRPRLVRAAGALLAFRGRWGVLAKACGYSLVLQAAVVANGYLLAKALGVPVPLPYFFLIVPLVVFVMMVPVSINAIGVRENAWAFFFVAFGVADAAALGVAVAWLDYGLVLLHALAGGVLWAWGRRGRGGREAAAPLFTTACAPRPSPPGRGAVGGGEGQEGGSLARPERWDPLPDSPPHGGFAPAGGGRTLGEGGLP